MSSVPSKRQSAGRYVMRHAVEVATAGYALFVLQLTLLPFDFVAGAAPSGLLGARLSDLHPLNVISNLALFVPFGVLMDWTALKHGRRAVRAAVDAALAAVALSLLVEWMQSYSPSRVSSMVDLLCNVGGAAIGAGLSSWCRKLLPKLLGAALIEFHDRPRTAVVHAYVLVLLVATAMPFTFAVDVDRIRDCAKAATFDLFEPQRLHAAKGQAAREAGDLQTWHREELLRQRFLASWAVEAASFAVLAWLLYPILRRDHRFARVSAVLLTAWMAVLLATVMSLVQGLVISRGFHVTDVAMRASGAGLGMCTRFTYVRLLSVPRGRVAPENLRCLAGVGLVGAIAFIMYTGLIPWVPTEGPLAWRRGAAFEFVPLNSYFHTRFDVMLEDATGKLAAYGVLGALLVGSMHRLARAPLERRVAVAVPAAAGLALVIELAQFYVPARVPGVTDVLVAAAGTWLGVVLHHHAVRLYEFTQSRQAVPGERMAAAGRMGVLDQLLATLADPREDAPQEPSPKPHRKIAPP